MAFVVLDFLRLAIFEPPDSSFVQLGSFLRSCQARSAPTWGAASSILRNVVVCLRSSELVPPLRVPCPLVGNRFDDAALRKPDYRHRRLLRAREHWQRNRRCAKPRDELAPSIPTRQRGSRLKNASTCARRSCLRRTLVPSASTPCTWNTFFAKSKHQGGETVAVRYTRRYRSETKRSVWRRWRFRRVCLAVRCVAGPSTARSAFAGACSTIPCWVASRCTSGGVAVADRRGTKKAPPKRGLGSSIRGFAPWGWDKAANPPINNTVGCTVQPVKSWLAWPARLNSPGGRLGGRVGGYGG